MVALAELEPELYVYALRGLLHGLDELLHLAFGQLEALGAYLHGLLVAEVHMVGEADLGYSLCQLALGHVGHAVLRVEGTAAVYMIIR